MQFLPVFNLRVIQISTIEIWRKEVERRLSLPWPIVGANPAYFRTTFSVL